MAFIHPSQSALETTANKDKITLEYAPSGFTFFSLYADCSSIIAVPAIGADARKTWAAVADDSISWLEYLQRKLPSSNVILYDHLEPEERRLELGDPKDPNIQTIARELASAEAYLAEYGVDDYADRLVGVVQRYRLFSGVRPQPRKRGTKRNLA